MQDQLVIFGWVMVAIFTLTILVPWLLRWTDLLTTWNLFIFGSINFVGYAAVQSGQGVYNYCLPTPDEYFKLMLGTLAFYVPCYAVYYRLRAPARLAGRTMLAWPPYSGVALGVLCTVCTGLMLLSMFYPNIQFIGQILIIIGPSAGVIAVALVFVRWWNNKRNAALLVLCAFLFGLSMLAAVHGQTGRRFLLSTLIVIPMCLYWLHLRYKPLIYTAVPVVVGAVGVMIILAGYTTIRHRYNAEIVNVTGRTALQTAVESMRLLPTAIVQLRGVRDVIGGDSMEASLVAINRYTKSAPPEPFFVVRYVLLNPLPRALWEDVTIFQIFGKEKPEALGQTLPRDTGVWQRTGYVNWGPGIPGHGFHEGGYHMLVFYGILYAMAMRYFDELLLRQSDNPYVLGMFAGASGQIVAFSRGDIGLFTVMILGAILAGLVVKWVGRMLLGNKIFYPSDAERAAIAQGAAAPTMPPDAELHIPQPYLAQYAEN